MVSRFLQFGGKPSLNHLTHIKQLLPDSDSLGQDVQVASKINWKKSNTALLVAFRDSWNIVAARVQLPWARCASQEQCHSSTM